jgi:chromosome segregation ATPase
MTCDLREWAEMMARHGHVQARQVLELIDAWERRGAMLGEMNALAAQQLRDLMTNDQKLAAAELAGRHAAERVIALETELTAAQSAILVEGVARNDAEARVIALEAELALARRTILELSERVAAQSELLSRKALREPACAPPRTDLPVSVPQPSIGEVR